MKPIIKFVGALLVAVSLASCGGGGGNPGTNPNNGSSSSGGTTTTTNPPVASIDVFTSGTGLSSAANSSITFTVVPKDANNLAIPSQPVTFSASSGNLNGALPTPSTGAAGEPVTGVSLSPGGDRSNRMITVTITSGGVSKPVQIPVSGSALSLSGNSFVLQAGNTTFTVKAVDSASLPIAGASLTVTSALGNAVSPATLTTNAQGVATFGYTATNAGNDTLSVAGIGASSSVAVAVSADQFSFESPASGASVAVGANQTVTVRYLQGGVPVVGQNVTFSTTRGTVTPTSGVTDATGRVSSTLSSSSAGPANVVAQAGSTQVTLPLTIVATNPTSLVLQANPGAVPPNSNGTTANQATLSAVVRDPIGNPVAGKVVNFTAIVDGSSGTINPGSAVTDSSGTAISIFSPGASTTANDGVVIQATVLGTAVSGTTSLTVNTQALFISILTGNQIGSVTPPPPSTQPTAYQKDFAVQVVDVNGAPVANKIISLAAVPDVYLKGALVFSTNAWVYDSGVVVCPNEDSNRNGVLDPGEDVNGNGTLQPGLPASLTASTVTTGSNGMATFSLQYGENFAPWVNVVITARTSVGGTESVRTQNYFLDGAAADFTNQSVPPAGQTSPFGTGTSCSDPN